jgi:hypothetical protein
MNKATLEGYINIGQYGGVKTTSTGKECTTFQLASGKGEKRMYFNCTVWHDEYGTERGVVDGKFAMIECYPRAWKKDGKSGVDFTVTRIWWSPDRETGGGKPVENSLYESDLPF